MGHKKSNKKKEDGNIEIVSHRRIDLNQTPLLSQKSQKQLCHKEDNESTSSEEKQERSNSSKSLRSFSMKDFLNHLKKGDVDSPSDNDIKCNTKEGKNETHSFRGFFRKSKKNHKQKQEQAIEIEKPILSFDDTHLEVEGNFTDEEKENKFNEPASSISPLIEEKNFEKPIYVEEESQIEVKLVDNSVENEPTKNCINNESMENFTASSSYSQIQDQTSLSDSTSMESLSENEMKEETDELKLKSSPLSPEIEPGIDMKQYNYCQEFSKTIYNNTDLLKKVNNYEQILKQNEELTVHNRQQQKTIQELELLLKDYETTDLLLLRTFPKFKENFNREKVVEHLFKTFNTEKIKNEKYRKIAIQLHEDTLKYKEESLQQKQQILELEKNIENLKRKIKNSESEKKEMIKKMNNELGNYSKCLECLSLFKDCCLEVLIKMTKNFENNLNLKILNEFKMQLNQISTKCSVENLQNLGNIEWIKEDINAFFLEETYNKFINEIVENYCKNLSKNHVLLRENETLLAKYYKQRKILKETKQNLTRFT